MSKPNSTGTMTPSQPRRVIGGRLEERDGAEVFVIVLDGGEEVETTDRPTAEAAAAAKRQGKALDLELDTRAAGRPRIIEFRTVDAPPAATSAATAQPSRAIAKPDPRPAQTALAKVPELPHGLIQRPEELAAQLRGMSEHYNVLSPAIAVSEMAPGYGANMAVVVIDPTVTFDRDRKSGSGPDTYYSKFMFQGDEQKRALNKQGLLKISQAAGVQWDPLHCRRLDDGRERFYWRWQYYGGIRTHDGQWQPLRGTRELDLRDGAGEAAQMTPNQLAQARSRGNEICETKAMQRAVRSLGIRQVYTVDELKKPFLIVRFSFTPDMNDPAVKLEVTRMAMSGIGALYQPPAAPALPAPPVDDIADAMPIVDAPTPKTEKQAAPASTAAPTMSDPFAETASADASLPAGSVTVAKVDRSTGKATKQGAPDWHLYKVTFSTGEVGSTFSETLHRLIDEAEQAKCPVRYSLTPNDNPAYDDKLVTFSIVDTRQPNLPGTEAPAGGY